MRTRLAAILACLLIGLVAAHGVAHAAIGACGSDPVVTFADGQTLAIQPEVDTSEIAHVTAIYLSITSNSANPPTGKSGQSSNENVTLHSSSSAHGWQVEMVIDTNDGSSLSDQFTVTYQGTTTTSAAGTLNSLFWVSMLSTFNQDRFPFSFTDSVGSHSGTLYWNTDAGDDSVVASVAVKIHLPTGSTGAHATPGAGETVTFLADQPAGQAAGAVDVTPTAGNTCNEAGSFAVDAYQQPFSGGACGTWDPATIPNFD